jgi:hypothetical protein
LILYIPQGADGTSFVTSLQVERERPSPHTFQENTAAEIFYLANRERGDWRDMIENRGADGEEFLADMRKENRLPGQRMHPERLTPVGVFLDERIVAPTEVQSANPVYKSGPLQGYTRIAVGTWRQRESQGEKAWHV